MPSHQFLAKNLEMDGSLARKLRLWRKQGRSFADISQQLSQNCLYVSRCSVDKWCHELGIVKK